ncbi:hypothetical protein BU17DRAFT_64388 [Hysterangium stoloniferum]|nr:hypothetical protein BU17DRAFT_64388 [Hysterangium stoloniferum]
MDQNNNVLHCYCQKCKGKLIAKRTKRRHRAAERKTTSSADEGVPSFKDWKKSTLDTFRSSKWPDRSYNQDQSPHSASRPENLSESGNSSNKEASVEWPEKRPRTEASQESSHLHGGVNEGVQTPDLDPQENDIGMVTTATPVVNQSSPEMDTDNFNRETSYAHVSDEDPASESESELHQDDQNLANEQQQAAEINQIHEEQLEPMSDIDNIHFTQKLIVEISTATLEKDKLTSIMLEWLRNPNTEPIDISDPDTGLSLDLFMACDHSSEATYDAIRQSILHHSPNTEVLSYYSVKKLVSDISGVDAVLDDMCIGSCIAYVGPYAHLKQCPSCSQPRFDPQKLAHTGKEVPRQQLYTFPLGPQLLALCRSLHASLALSYRTQKITEILEKFGVPGSPDDLVYDDIFCGSDICALAQKLSLTGDDILIGLSLDGAQLHISKKSDAWIGIWVIFDHDPVRRYIKKHILPAFVISGPGKPKNQDSFLFCSFYHLSALQHENEGKGMLVWDALQKKTVYSRVMQWD